jgi:polysaccharide biosynthesis/export protein
MKARLVKIVQVDWVKKFSVFENKGSRSPLLASRPLCKLLIISRLNLQIGGIDLALNDRRVRSILVRFPKEDVVLKRNRLSLILALAGGFAASWTVSLGAQAPETPTKKTGQATESDAPKKDRTSTSAQTDPILNQALASYQIGADDELMISVWHEPELSQAVVVRPDGIITLPLLNDVKVAGMTTVELQAALTERLKAVVNDPQVTVSVKSVKSQRVFLTGMVGKQGVYPMGGGLTVLQLIAQAGGLGPFAKVRSIYILRHENGKETRIPFNYKKALSGKGGDVVLQSGDMVVVP